MLCAVLAAIHDFDISRIVVRLDAVDMMNDLTTTQPTAKLPLGDQPVLVGIAANIGQMMISPDTDKNVAV